MRDEPTRRRIVEAVLRLVTSRGPDSTTVRNVATEADVSVGAVQHHFHTKEDLLLGAMDAVVERFRTRVESLADGSGDARDLVAAFLTAIACADPDNETDDVENAIVWTVFAARACVDDRIRAAHTASWLEAERILLELLRHAYGPEVGPDDAAGLLALTDGIAVARVAEGDSRMPRERAVRLIDAALGRLDAAARDRRRG
ncbi:AcrR family transcriptional regulator [Pseudoclavibacter chungangensis]|nr:TetR/AcrR family transcriptional regulator [Pseudoclavibacter chungangensis]NYJ67322.1 AcrR family transcriptional regulator [Pseudoclavibacter chungangensis]